MNPLEATPLDAQTKSSNNAVSDQERELAHSAHEEYSKCDYQSCAASLAKLEVLRPHDFKVTHNKIIMDYYKSNDAKKTEILKKSLNAICGQGGNLPENEDIEKSVSRYNQAVILYHSRQYQAALEIVNSLFNLSEQMGKFSGLFKDFLREFKIEKFFQRKVLYIKFVFCWLSFI